MTQKERKTASPHSFLVNPGCVQIIGQVNISSIDNEKVASVKRKVTPTKESAKKKSCKSPSSSDGIKALEDKWSQRFSRLEAMILAKSVQLPAGQPTLQQISIPVSPKKKPPVHSLQIDLLFSLPDWSIRPLQASPLPVPVRCQWLNLLDWAFSLLPASPLPVPVRRVYLLYQ